MPVIIPAFPPTMAAGTVSRPDRTAIGYGAKNNDGDTVVYEGERSGHRYRLDAAGRRGWPAATQFICACCMSARRACGTTATRTDPSVPRYATLAIPATGADGSRGTAGPLRASTSTLATTAGALGSALSGTGRAVRSPPYG